MIVAMRKEFVDAARMGNFDALEDALATLARAYDRAIKDASLRVVSIDTRPTRPAQGQPNPPQQ